MTDPWQFWMDQLRGLEPDCTPGTPHQGYYLNRNRKTYPNPEPGPGKPRKKVSTSYDPVAIWQDEDGWHCVITGPEGKRYLNNVEAIDNLFSYCCRNAIGYDEYLEKVAEYEAAFGELGEVQ